MDSLACHSRSQREQGQPAGCHQRTFSQDRRRETRRLLGLREVGRGEESELRVEAPGLKRRRQLVVDIAHPVVPRDVVGCPADA
eukprot:2918615-Rhodomonas_salina.1